VRNRAERLDLDQAEALELLAAVRARSSTPRRSPKSGQ
jgi:hypothetical protein